MRPALAAALTLVLCGATGPVTGEEPVATGSVVGWISVPPPARSVATFDAYPGRAHGRPDDSETIPAAENGAFADVVVHVSGDLPVADPGRNGPPPRLAQQGMRFVPRVLPILRGRSVEFPNFDPFYHNVFSFSKARRFDLGKYAQGESAGVEFPEAGEVRVFCDIHSDMNAVILVLENPCFARPDASGRFEIPNVPAGQREIVAFHPDLPAARATVLVPAGGSAEIRLTLAP